MENTSGIKWAEKLESALLKMSPSSLLLACREYKIPVVRNTVNDVQFRVILSDNITALKFYLIASSLIHLVPTTQSSFEDVRPNLLTGNA